MPNAGRRRGPGHRSSSSSPHRTGALSALIPLVVLGALIAAACTAEEPAGRGEASGATVEEIRTEDGLTLDARLWDRGRERIAIYLHEFRDDQSSWWSYVERDRPPRVSALTFDLRGHGQSEGSIEDVEGMVLDAVAAIAFARDLGYERVMLVGAGMGAAVALVAAVEAHDVTVVGFSTPADFDALDTVAVLELVADRVQLIATRDDVSAADSLRQFRALGNVDTTQARLYPGSSHGVAALEGRAGADIRARFETLLDEFWVPRQG